MEDREKFEAEVHRQFHAVLSATETDDPDDPRGAVDRVRDWATERIRIENDRAERWRTKALAAIDALQHRQVDNLSLRRAVERLERQVADPRFGPKGWTLLECLRAAYGWGRNDEQERSRGEELDVTLDDGSRVNDFTVGTASLGEIRAGYVESPVDRERYAAALVEIHRTGMTRAEELQLELKEVQPRTRCGVCGRFSWKEETGVRCGLPQPDGGFCDGTMGKIG